ncbi:hypothetical protein ADIS_0252 [Lunatimonas lonarensis]|uniref:Uncharacterized protein n=1 Tax=Lunatimonas lonarensis TaxID=1232681 RepID=R7ZYS4_9BACT|nr:hypothetical protein ADIS_0252 [Lunatimonas lonarensis]
MGTSQTKLWVNPLRVKQALAYAPYKGHTFRFDNPSFGQSIPFRSTSKN